MIIEARFQGARTFSEGLAAVTVNDKQGFIDRTGKMAIPATFDVAKDFGEGLAPVKTGNAYRYIDKQGRVAVGAGLTDKVARFEAVELT